MDMLNMLKCRQAGNNHLTDIAPQNSNQAATDYPLLPSRAPKDPLPPLIVAKTTQPLQNIE